MLDAIGDTGGQKAYRQSHWQTDSHTSEHYAEGGTHKDARSKPQTEMRFRSFHSIHH